MCEYKEIKIIKNSKIIRVKSRKRQDSSKEKPHITQSIIRLLIGIVVKVETLLWYSWNFHMNTIMLNDPLLSVQRIQHTVNNCHENKFDWPNNASEFMHSKHEFQNKISKQRDNKLYNCINQGESIKK